MTVTIPAGATIGQTYYIGIYADSGDLIAPETSDYNNGMGVPANIQKPLEPTWSFVFITDPHIGRTSEDQKHHDYNTTGWDIVESGPECITTEDLRTTIRGINSLTQDHNIKFVVVGGDITDSGELSEFTKAIEILDSELDIPWIPIPGNHDMRPFVWEWLPDAGWDQPTIGWAGWHYSDMFEEQYNKLSEDFPENWDKPNPGIENQWLQNFSFDFSGYHLIFLDFNSREENEKWGVPGSGVGGELHYELDGTWPWLINDINTYLLRQPSGSEDIILFSHHPFLLDEEKCFDSDELDTIAGDLQPYAGRIWGQFAGHTHNNSDENGWPLILEIMEVIETHATAHASGDGVSARLVRINDGTIQDWALAQGMPDVEWPPPSPPSGLTLQALSPVDLIVTDPDGLSTGTGVNTIPGAAYLVYDVDGDGDMDDVVTIPQPKPGDYQITLIPEPGALPTDTYTLEILADGEVMVLADDVPISDIPSEPYVFESDVILPGDFDGDGDIDIFDFVYFADAYGSEAGDPNYNAIGDFDNDGDIDFFDFVDFADVYGT